MYCRWSVISRQNPQYGESLKTPEMTNWSTDTPTVVWRIQMCCSSQSQSVTTDDCSFSFSHIAFVLRIYSWTIMHRQKLKSSLETLNSICQLFTPFPPLIMTNRNVKISLKATQTAYAQYNHSLPLKMPGIIFLNTKIIVFFVINCRCGCFWRHYQFSELV